VSSIGPGNWNKDEEELSTQLANGYAEMIPVDPKCLTTAMPRCRPFRLVDAMVLIAATAVWMAWIRSQWNQLQNLDVQLQNLDVLVGRGITHLPWQSYLGFVYNGFNIALLMLAVAYLVIRLVPPRPSMSDLIRQPGMLFLGLMIALSILLMLLSVFVPLVPWTNMIIALALGRSWLAASRRYRSHAELGWIENIGRSVAVGLIVSNAAAYPLYLLMA
jgi:hypothetical protein